MGQDECPFIMNIVIGLRGRHSAHHRRLRHANTINKLRLFLFAIVQYLSNKRCWISTDNDASAWTGVD